MIEVVTEADFDRLGAIRADEPRAKQRAVAVLMEIVNRLPRPRAYISEPTHTPDESRQTLWTLAYDMLTATLPADEGVSVIEPETIRDIALFSSSLDYLTDATDPFWQTLVSCKAIDQVCIPNDGENTKRHSAMRNHANVLKVQVRMYHPVVERVRRPAGQPRT